jgi:hypothetical protein
MCADRAAKLGIDPADNGTMTGEYKFGLFEQGPEATLVDLHGDAKAKASLLVVGDNTTVEASKDPA